MTTRAVLRDFKIIRPRYETPQAESLLWLAQAHARMHGDSPEHMHKALRRFGCSPEMISRRGHELADPTHQDWDRMEIFRVPEGMLGLEARTRFFQESVTGVMRRFYLEEREPPQSLIHVTCSGYVSPSAAQSLVAERGWHQETRVTHVYHMGCYAAFPAIRIAEGYLSSNGARAAPGGRVDIVHTELCSIHLNPGFHTPEQLVVQTLFADGFVKYSVGTSHGQGRDQAAGLAVLALHEEIIPGTGDQMTWLTSDWGMQMTLSRTVPEKLAASLEGFLRRLFAHAELGYEEALGSSVFAIHPGGPHIIDLIRDRLGLTDHDLRFSRTVLFDYGNMSSATLPHIWSRILAAPEVKSGTRIVSLAFGPGLTICGAVLSKT